MIKQIKLISDSGEINRVYEFLKSYPLNYPQFELWLDKCKRELEIGYKKGFFAKDEKGLIIACAIFQADKEDGKILELKNLRVASEYSDLGIGSSICSIVETYALEEGYQRLRCDAHADNPIIGFMESQGFKVEAEEYLYSKSILEKIMVKELNTRY